MRQDSGHVRSDDSGEQSHAGNASSGGNVQRSMASALQGDVLFQHEGFGDHHGQVTAQRQYTSDAMQSVPYRALADPQGFVAPPTIGIHVSNGQQLRDSLRNHEVVEISVSLADTVAAGPATSTHQKFLGPRLVKAPRKRVQYLDPVELGILSEQEALVLFQR